MNELRIYTRNGGLYMSSRDVAPMIGLPHDQLVADIADMVSTLQAEGEDVSEKFIPRKQGKAILYYMMSRSGCDAVAIALTPDNTTRLVFINRYTDKFRRREETLKNLLSESWQKKRALNKAGQADFNDTIKGLVEYAESCGSTNAKRYYNLYNKLLDSAVGLNSGERDTATATQLEELNKLNTMAGRLIRQGIAEGIDYHLIYKNVREKVELYQELQELAMPKLTEVV